MKKIRNISAILLALAMCFALVACGGGGNNTSNAPAPSTSNAPAPSTSNAPAPSTSTAPTPAQTGIESAAPVGQGGLTVRGTAAPGTINGTIGYGQVIDPLPGTEFEDVINMIIEVPYTVCDPQSAGGTASVNRLSYVLIYNRLVYFDVNQVIQPELATSWETDDAQTWIFHLRNDVTFHNGDKFTAADVVYTAERSRQEPGSLAWDQWMGITSIKALDDYTVEIVLDAPYSSFAYNLTLPGGAIVNKRAIEADPVKGPWIGTGAFYVSDMVTGTSLQFTRNDNYWGPKAYTKTMNWIFVPEVASRTVMLLNGEMDVCLSVAPTDNDMFVDDDGYIVYSYAANTTHSLTFSMINPITGDKNFRLAVAHAINREEAAVVSSGRWAKVTRDGTFWGDSTPFRNTSIPQIPQDLDKAKEYLALSTYKGEQLEILTAPDTLTVSSQMIQEQLRAIGINCTVRTADVGTLVSESRYGDTNLTLLHFVGPFELDPTSVKVNLYPDMSANRASYNNPEVNALIDSVMAEPDPAEQQRIYYRIQELVAEDIPALSIFERIWTIVTNDKVGGIIVNPDMNHDLTYIFKMK